MDSVTQVVVRSLDSLYTFNPSSFVLVQLHTIAVAFMSFKICNFDDLAICGEEENEFLLF